MKPTIAAKTSANREDWQTMQDVDGRLGQAKGTAFRAFKQLLPTLREATDFIVLDHRQFDALGARLQAQGRIYKTSISPVLMSPQTAERVVRAASNEAPPTA